MRQVITPEGELVSRQCVPGKQCPCVFEYIYLARPDSVLDDIPVYNFQLGLGTRLARRIRDKVRRNARQKAASISGQAFQLAAGMLSHPGRMRVFVKVWLKHRNMVPWPCRRVCKRPVIGLQGLRPSSVSGHRRAGTLTVVPLPGAS